MEYRIKTYKTSSGKRPFKNWLDDLADMKTRAAIDLRLERVSMGNLGNCKSLEGGLYELKFDIGPGYRVYFGKIGKQIILLLCAGSKRSQPKDITKDREYLMDYKSRRDEDD